MKFRRFLVPLDFSECSRNALGYAINLARHLEGSVEALHVWHTPYFVQPDMVLSLPHRPPVSIRDWVESRALEEMESIIQRCPSSEVRVTLRLEEGEPEPEIVRRALQVADAIVMGTERRSGIQRTLLGSSTEKVVRTSAVPVLVVPYDPIGEQPH
ncbi:MAG: universal stress protein [Deltaproteobacteria bacterium]|nr:universal stress protein [Deltaproteobacteria bacterium]